MLTLTPPPAKTPGTKNLPVLTDEQEEARLNRTESQSARCFIGIHKKAVSFWPTGDCVKIARQLVCSRCGELLKTEEIKPS